MTTRDEAAWIRGLIESDHLLRFYNSRRWIRLRNQVLREDHYECQVCRERGVLTQACTVHHVNEVRDRPDLALSIYFLDALGNKKRNLISICRQCHNEAHRRFSHRPKPMPLTPERW